MAIVWGVTVNILGTYKAQNVSGLEGQGRRRTRRTRLGADVPRSQLIGWALTIIGTGLMTLLKWDSPMGAWAG